MRRHPFDPWSFVLGALFLGTGLVFLTNSVDVLHTSAARLWPIPVLALGMLIVLTNAKRVRQRRSLVAEVEALHEPEVSAETGPDTGSSEATD